jgi:hypothetical protein
MSPELVILLLNTVLIVVAYQYVYPRWVGNNMQKLIMNDLIATFISLVVAGSLYSGSGEDFSLLVMTVNWFWFSLVTYSLMEMPMAMRYMRRHNMLQ